MACVLGISTPAQAHDEWSEPFAGVRRLKRTTANQHVNVLQIDLCAAGVEARATAGSEKGRTVSSFGQLVGAQMAINGDFFGSGYSTDGLSAHDGALWSGSDHTYVAPLAFGAGRVELRPHEDQTGLESWMDEVVSGHPTILWDGQGRNNNGDPLCSNRHPRTAVGLSADGRTLILAVVDGRATSRIGMTCDELSALMAEMGASRAMNMDGGGSSTMWLSGTGVVNVPSDGSQRVVGNHLAVYATGSGDAPHCPNLEPRGYLDGAQCEAISGWAQDPDEPDRAIDVHVYFDGGPGEEGAFALATTADRERADLCDAIGSCAHGFELEVPGALRDGQPHPVRAYAIDSEGGHNPPLVGGPMMVSCEPEPLPRGHESGSLRHIVSPESLAAWQLSFHDVVPLDADTVSQYPIGSPMPEVPELVRATGSDQIYLLDGDVARPVDGDTLAAWRLAEVMVAEVDPATLDGYPRGAELVPVPYALRGDGSAVYLVDVADPADPTDVQADQDNELGGGCQLGSSGGPASPVILATLALWLATGRRRKRR